MLLQHTFAAYSPPLIYKTADDVSYVGQQETRGVRPTTIGDKGEGERMGLALYRSQGHSRLLATQRQTCSQLSKGTAEEEVRTGRAISPKKHGLNSSARQEDLVKAQTRGCS